MGCFLSLFCGIQERNRRSERQQQLENENNLDIASESTSVDANVFVYQPDSLEYAPERNAGKYKYFKRLTIR